MDSKTSFKMDTKKNLTIGLFIFLSIISIIRLHDNSTNLDAWQYGEWLINYQFGFVRRGLIGEIIYSISLLFDGNIKISFILVVSSIILLFYYLNYILIKDIKFNKITLLIIFSPLLYFFFVIISKVGIKKEIIFYIFYLVFLISLLKKDFTLSKCWKFIFIFQLILMIHEGMFFFLPYIIIPLLILSDKNKVKLILLQIIALFVLSSLTLLLLYFYKGSENHVIEICNSLDKYAPMKCSWWGPIYALGHELQIGPSGKSNLFFYIHNDVNAYIGFAIYILYGFAPILFFLKYFEFDKKNILLNKKMLIICLSLSFLFSLPLFHFTEDWSRWFSIHLHLITFLYFFMLRNKIINFNININLGNFNFISYLIRNKIAFIILLFLYTTSLHHHHFFFEGVRLESTYYKVYKKISN